MTSSVSSTCTLRDARSGAAGAFTLLELLVVIAVVSILLAIMLPALRSARETGRTAACLSNARQIAVALWMYEGENKGFVPREGTMGTTPGTLRARLPWNVAFRPYLDDRCTPGVDLDDLFAAAPYYRCPARAPGPHPVHMVANGFAFLSPGVPEERGIQDPQYRRGPMPSWLVARPWAMLYLTDLNDDADAAMFNVWITLGKTDLSLGQCYDAWLPKHLTEGSGDFRIGPARHGGGAMALFLDAHAAWRERAFFMDVRSWDDGWYAKP